MLNKRAKWFSSPESRLKTGDLFWLIEDNRPRYHYALAGVKSLNYGNNGIARSAVIRSATGEYTDPIVKLAPVLTPLGAEDVNAINYASFFIMWSFHIELFGSIFGQKRYLKRRTSFKLRN